jgi:hypothetical protein
MLFVIILTKAHRTLIINFFDFNVFFLIFKLFKLIKKLKIDKSIIEKMMNKNYSNIFFGFLEGVKKIKDKNLSNLDPSEEKLLHQLGLVWSKGINLTVLEAMSLMPNVSIGTTHRRLKALRKKGFLDLAQDSNDQRVKYIVPTPQAGNYFLTLGDCLKTAVMAV